ncbi:outer membrane lipoprotein-sorting protein [Arcicella sp. LKC2W]|uniref:outer membrane lipoprotein-sorting protein n=1 Tax=Arcicella sp. LKC2W TaxID=2984198 RepID=UPI002B20D0F8|nr:outer membrane lipoprotein-sorting protein [Arcicella sp. LKC2W]MEA5460879.1 outer membrane lipoprotein-sorting protein [Arcicella sp. LKC2W]
MKKLSILLIISVLCANVLFSQDQEVVKALKKSDFYRGGSEGIEWNVKVQNIEQGQLKNDLVLSVEGSANDSHFYSLISFLEPKKFGGQKLLIRDNNMWFIKQGLTNPVPISSRQRLSGSAANADVAAANYSKDYTIESVENGTFNNANCWVLELKAKDNLITYPKVKYWISKKENFGLKAEFYGKSDKLIKTATFEYHNKIEYKSQKYDYLSKISISDMINKDDKTILSISSVSFPVFSSSKFQKDRLLD